MQTTTRNTHHPAPEVEDSTTASTSNSNESSSGSSFQDMNMMECLEEALSCADGVPANQSPKYDWLILDDKIAENPEVHVSEDLRSV